jgi:cardiolipin synthase
MIERRTVGIVRRNGFVLALILTASLIHAQSQECSDSIVMAFLASRQIPVTANNTLTLLKSGAEKFDALLDDIAGAEHHIHFEYFYFRNDSITNLLLDILASKAQQGVQVRIIFDAAGNMLNSKPFKKKQWGKIREQGIEIAIFDPVCFPYFNHIGHRDHRKIAVIDGRIGYTGGINVADYYINGLPDIGEWRDMHVRMEGEAVDCLQQIFLDIWALITGQDIDGDNYSGGVFATGDGKQIAIIDRMPRKTNRQMREAYIRSMNAAQSKIQIVNAYFIPGKSIKKALKKAIERGVTVEIMISAKSDIKITPEEWKKRSKWKRFAGWLVNLLLNPLL